MPFTLNGFGTHLYGARDFRPDGSYVTTEWVVLAYIPIVPLRSMRISRSGNSMYLVVYNRTGYYVLEKTKPNGMQVLCVYGWFAAIALSIAASSVFKQPALLLVIPLMFIVPFYLRNRARKRMSAANERTDVGMSDKTIS